MNPNNKLPHPLGFELAFFTVLLLLCSGCPNTTKPSARVLSWGVLDQATKINNNVPAGGSLTIVPADPYVVTLRATDPDGVQAIAIWADGSFTCSTVPKTSGSQSWMAPNPLPVSIPKKQTSPTPASYSGFLTTDPFVYFNLFCGTYSYNGTPPNQQYFVSSGTLHFQAAETSQSGVTTTVTLDLSR
jgi:hypothetical protein